jgi:hypothetical protein
MVISLIDFIQTGRFGDLKIGSTRDDAIKAFGPPDREGRLTSDRNEYFMALPEIEWVNLQALDSARPHFSGSRTLLRYANE